MCLSDDALYEWKQRAEWAEAEANNAHRVYNNLVDQWGQEIDLADRLAEALVSITRLPWEGHEASAWWDEWRKPALAAWQEARRR